MFPIRDNIGWTKPPMVVWTLILLNVAVFAYQLGLSERETQMFLMKHALVPLRYFSPRWASDVGLSPLDLTPFVTNTFLHGGFLHIILNMWTLYIFGPALEDRLGTVRFLVLYLGAGVAASVTHALFNATSPVPALGASGAIAGLISAYALRFPYAWVRVLVLIIIIPLFFDIPAMLFAGLWFLSQILQGTSSLFMPALGGGIAWWAHIGGFVAGWLLLRPLDRTLQPGRLSGPWGPAERGPGPWRTRW
jgi:membrane associated rhomboid family serine protease